MDFYEKRLRRNIRDAQEMKERIKDQLDIEFRESLVKTHTRICERLDRELERLKRYLKAKERKDFS